MKKNISKKLVSALIVLFLVAGGITLAVADNSSSTDPTASDTLTVGLSPSTILGGIGVDLSDTPVAPVTDSSGDPAVTPADSSVNDPSVIDPADIIGGIGIDMSGVTRHGRCQ